MLFSRFTVSLACLAPLAAAWTQPKGASPKGNPISLPGLNDVLPAGKDYTITWKPTTAGTVTILLLKGPSTNAVPQFALAEKVPNSGSFVWPVNTSLEPGQVGYGIELIDDATGQYQYSTQFGISNPDWKKDGSSSSSSSSGSASHKAATITATATASGSAHVSANATTPCTTSTSTTAKPYLPTGSGYPCNSSSVVRPTKPMTVPSSLLTTSSATATPPSPPANSTTVAPQNNGAAAAHVAGSFVGLIVAAGVAVLAL